jgi:hypothetical protein
MTAGAQVIDLFFFQSHPMTFAKGAQTGMAALPLACEFTG